MFAKRPEKASGSQCIAESFFATLASVYFWADNKLLDYHEAFDKSSMKNVVTLVVSAAELLGQHVQPAATAAGSSFAAADLVERYVESSVRRTFAKLDEGGNAGGSSMLVEVEEDPGEALMYVASQTNEMAKGGERLSTPPF